MSTGQIFICCLIFLVLGIFCLIVGDVNESTCPNNTKKYCWILSIFGSLLCSGSFIYFCIYMKCSGSYMPCILFSQYSVIFLFLCTGLIMTVLGLLILSENNCKNKNTKRLSQIVYIPGIVIFILTLIYSVYLYRNSTFTNAQGLYVDKKDLDKPLAYNNHQKI